MVSQLDIMSTPRGLSPGYRGISAAYNSLHLIFELPVQQSVYKRIDSRIKQHHCVRNDAVYGETNVEGCSKELHVIDHCTHKPTDSEYSSDNHDHQGYSLSNPYDALCIERRRVLLKWHYLHNMNGTSESMISLIVHSDFKWPFCFVFVIQLVTNRTLKGNLKKTRSPFYSCTNFRSHMMLHKSQTNA